MRGCDTRALPYVLVQSAQWISCVLYSFAVSTSKPSCVCVRPRHDAGFAPVSHRVGPSSIPVQSKVRFMVEKLAFGQIFLPVLPFPCRYHSTIAAYLLLLPEGRTGEDWERSKKNAVFGNREALAGMYFRLVFYVIFRKRLTYILSPLIFGPLKFAAAPFIRR